MIMSRNVNVRTLFSQKVYFQTVEIKKIYSQTTIIVDCKFRNLKNSICIWLHSQCNPISGSCWQKEKRRKTYYSPGLLGVGLFFAHTIKIFSNLVRTRCSFGRNSRNAIVLHRITNYDLVQWRSLYNGLLILNSDINHLLVISQLPCSFKHSRGMIHHNNYRIAAIDLV